MSRLENTNILLNIITIIALIVNNIPIILEGIQLCVENILYDKSSSIGICHGLPFFVLARQLRFECVIIATMCNERALCSLNTECAYMECFSICSFKLLMRAVQCKISTLRKLQNVTAALQRTPTNLGFLHIFTISCA